MIWDRTTKRLLITGSVAASCPRLDIHALAQRLQTDGGASFVKSWNELMGVISSKGAALK